MDSHGTMPTEGGQRQKRGKRQFSGLTRWQRVKNGEWLKTENKKLKGGLERTLMRGEAAKEARLKKAYQSGGGIKLGTGGGKLGRQVQFSEKSGRQGEGHKRRCRPCHTWEGRDELVG